MADDPPVPDPRWSDPEPPASGYAPPAPPASGYAPPVAPMTPAAAVPPVPPTAADPEPAFPQPESTAPAAAPWQPEPAESAPVAHDGEPEPVAKRRRGRRTALILAGAAVLGVLAGGGVGYRIQQQRTPTPLPPLTGPVLAQPKGAGRPAPVLPAAQDRQAVYDGDLLALLVPAPKGSKDAARGWQTLGEYADRFTVPDTVFKDFASNNFRRMAGAWWRSGRQFVTVDLVQFRDEAMAYAPQDLSRSTVYMSDSDQYGDSKQIHGTMDGAVWGSAKPEEKAGYVPIYHARGIARVGSIEVDVLVDSPEPISSSTVMSVITKQLERL